MMAHRTMEEQQQNQNATVVGAAAAHDTSHREMESDKNSATFNTTADQDYQQVRMLLAGNPPPVLQQTSSLMHTRNSAIPSGLYVNASTNHSAVTTAGVTPTIITPEQVATQWAQQRQFYSLFNIPMSNVSADPLPMDIRPANNDHVVSSTQMTMPTQQVNVLMSNGSADPLPVDFRPASNNHVVSSTQRTMPAPQVMTAAGFASQAGRLHAADVNNFAHLPTSKLSNATCMPQNCQTIIDQLTQLAPEPQMGVAVAPPPPGLYDHLFLSQPTLTIPAPNLVLTTSMLPLHPSPVPYIQDDDDDDSLSVMLPENFGLDTRQLSTNNLHANTYKADDNTRSILIQPQLQPHVGDSEPIVKQERQEDHGVQSQSAVPSQESIHGAYNVNEIWCDECQKSYPDGCETHRQISVSDNVVPTRAWASLPDHLEICAVGDTPEFGVFADESIAKGMRFGPFVAVHKQNKETLNDPKFLLMLQQDNGTSYLQTTDENHCNWMMFVRPATNYSEQNLVAYQYGTEIYFTTIKSIDVRQELKVWYASHYAHQMGVKTHDVIPVREVHVPDLKSESVERDVESHMSEPLQPHLEGANAGDGRSDAGTEDSGLTQQRAQNTRTKSKLTCSENGTFPPWRKRHYLKILKKYTRASAATSDASRRPLYRQRHGDHGGDTGGGGGKEWLCSHCDLTFDNASVLNLHTLTHAAEDVDRENDTVNGESAISASDSSQQPPQHACPVCARVFACKQQLIEHASEHARPQSSRHNMPHTQLHRRVCKSNECVLCHAVFQQNCTLCSHAETHKNDDGQYLCPICARVFADYPQMCRHMQFHHLGTRYPCSTCSEKNVKQVYCYMVIHSTHRENRGRQCKRMNQLMVHTRRMHDYERFIYKCHACRLGFKRRGMLVNHLAKRHTR